MATIFESYKNTVIENFGLTESDFGMASPNLISPFVLELPRSVLESAQNIARDLHKLVQNEHYQKQVAEEIKNLHVSHTPLTPLLCSLDVHLDSNNELKIIEINTNASAYLINAMSYKARGLDTFPHAMEDIVSNFASTIAQGIERDQRLVIMDDQPMQQKLIIEFLMYQKLFEKVFTVKCDIADPSQLILEKDGTLSIESKRVFGIYNRHTDFYFKSLSHILSAHNAQKVKVSPHPWGYALLADKNRMTDLQNPEWCKELSLLDYPHLKKALLKTVPFSQFASADDLWKTRSQYFFKPAESFGSKSVYSGKSISRTKFEAVFAPDMLAQEVAPPPEVTFDNNGTPEKFKYDLRFFFFEDKVQLAFARTYRGQLTNLQTPLGGHAPLVFV